MEPFGFPRSKLNADLSLALGASAITSMELATGYAVLANGGYAVTPYLISHIEDDKGNLLYEAEPATVCPNCNEQNSRQDIDRKSTRLNSSHVRISYAVFCLKKKKAHTI